MSAIPCKPSEHDWRATTMYGNGDCYRCLLCGRVGKMRARGMITLIRGELPKPKRLKATERHAPVNWSSADGRRVPKKPDLDGYDTWAAGWPK